MKKWICLILTAVMLFSMSITVLATEDDYVPPAVDWEEENTETVSEESSEDMIQSSEIVDDPLYKEELSAKPYLALGADLTPEQLATVLNEMGLLGEDLSEYDIVYITNAMEHEYLDGYIASSVIGTRSLSSVMVKQKPKGSGLVVTTKNITYCTISMYKNALITSGVEDAEIIIVGPSPISGTAALIGAMKAYESLAGETLSQEAQDTAMEELVVLGRLRESFEDEEQIQEFMDYIKAEVIAKGLEDPEKIAELVEEAAKQYGITLTDEQKEMIVSLMKKIGELDIDPAKLLEQAADLYDKYGETILKDAKEFVDSVFTEEVKESIWTAIGKFFQSLWDTILGWFNE